MNTNDTRNQLETQRKGGRVNSNLKDTKKKRKQWHMLCQIRGIAQVQRSDNDSGAAAEMKEGKDWRVHVRQGESMHERRRRGERTGRREGKHVFYSGGS